MFRCAVDQFHAQRKPRSPRATPPESADVKMEDDGSSDRSSSRSGSSHRAGSFRHGAHEESNRQDASGESLKRRRPDEHISPNKRISPIPRDASMESEEKDELAEDN